MKLWGEKLVADKSLAGWHGDVVVTVDSKQINTTWAIITCSAVFNILPRENGKAISKANLLFFNHLLSTVAKLKCAVITQKSKGTESISMQMILSYWMRSADPANVVY